MPQRNLALASHNHRQGNWCAVVS